MATIRSYDVEFPDEEEHEDDRPFMTESEFNDYIRELEDMNPGCTGYSNQFD